VPAERGGDWLRDPDLGFFGFWGFQVLFVRVTFWGSLNDPKPVRHRQQQRLVASHGIWPWGANREHRCKSGTAPPL
jgi:hypothetical protein